MTVGGMKTWYRPDPCGEISGGTPPPEDVSKMLRVIGTDDGQAPRLVPDEYIPLEVRWDGPVKDRVYWRGGDHRRSLVEVGLLAESGRMSTITVVLAGDRLDSPSDPLPAPIRLPETGLPICDLGPLKGKHYLDVASPFTFVVRPDSLSIWFASPETVESELDCLPVRFHLSEKREIIGFSVLGLTDVETRRLKELVSLSRDEGGKPYTPS